MFLFRHTESHYKHLSFAFAPGDVQAEEMEFHFLSRYQFLLIHNHFKTEELFQMS